MGFRFLLPGLLLILAAGCEQSGYSQPASHQPTAEPVSADSSRSPPAPTGALPTDAQEPVEEKPAVDPAKPYVDDGSKDPSRKGLPHKDITFDDIKFDIAKDSKFKPSLLTPQIEELVGRRVRIRGFIFPSFQQKLRIFVLTRDNQECCFGPGAAIYDCIQVTMAPGTTAEYTTRIVTVEGHLTLRELLDFDDAGITRAIYHLDATSVK